MKSIWVFFLIIAVVAAGTSYCTTKWMSCCQPNSKGTEDAHAWLHADLALTQAQKDALAPIEKRFAETNRRLEQQMKAANRELAQALSKGRPDAPEISAAIDKIHHHMGEMQKASIAHLFEMRDVLTPEQGDKLMALARKALENSP